MIILFLISWLSAKHPVDLGAVDLIEGKLCKIQLTTGEIVQLESDICHHLHEGDMLKVVRIECR